MIIKVAVNALISLTPKRHDLAQRPARIGTKTMMKETLVDGEAKQGVTAGLQRLALAVVFGSATQVVCAADLEVEIRGVRPRGGEVHTAVFDRAEDFALDTEIRAMITPSGEISAGVFTDEDYLRRAPVGRLSVTPNARTLRLTFPDLEPGEYAVGAYQDRNGNNILDTTVVRDATEPWGVSNNPRPEGRAVTWDEAKFTLPPEGAKIVIELH